MGTRLSLGEESVLVEGRTRGNEGGVARLAVRVVPAEGSSSLSPNKELKQLDAMTPQQGRQPR